MTKVLIADDEPNIVVSLSFMMRREGYEVLVARDGTEALDTIRRERPALVLLDATRATAELVRERGAALVVDVPERVPEIRADPDRLTQVVLNLLSNAAKFVPAAGGAVTVGLREEPGALVVAVADNGPGVPLADQAGVFEKFRQGGDSLTRPPGTGLGLPISRQIVDHFGGTMWLESEPGNGATFAFRLPLRPGGKENGHESADR